MLNEGGPPDSSKRWSSARLLRFGIRVYPKGKLINRAGILTFCRVGGKAMPSTSTHAELCASMPTPS